MTKCPWLKLKDEDGKEVEQECFAPKKGKCVECLLNLALIRLESIDAKPGNVKDVEQL